MMFEMRWIESASGRVLQYRYFRTHRLEGDRPIYAVKLADWSDDYGWTEWMDVPVESE